MRVVWAGLYLAMIVGGVLTLLLQLLYSPALSLKYAAGSGAIAIFAAYLLWEDFLR
jgi:putative Ca2+/H+ antiporter (TMEM165/GDT1 family)